MRELIRVSLGEASSNKIDVFLPNTMRSQSQVSTQSFYKKQCYQLLLNRELWS